MGVLPRVSNIKQLSRTRMLLHLLLITSPVLIQEALPAPLQDDIELTESAELSQFHVNTTIGFRYSRTEVTALYRNPGLQANTAVFTMVLLLGALLWDKLLG